MHLVLFEGYALPFCGKLVIIASAVYW